MSKSKNMKAFDSQGFISCKCKTPFSKSSIERSNFGSNKKLSKITSKKFNRVHANNYKVAKGTELAIGTYLNQCKCTLFSGKARTSSHRTNRKDPSYVRTKYLKGIDHVRVQFN
tara:strand:+ start:5124 stop:5465 length:342 start_codon:yes stop_codon:yes gene_type:complete